MSQAPRRRLTRRPPPRPTYEGSAGVVSTGARPVPAAEARQARRYSPSQQSPYLGAELKRVAGVTTVCFVLLAVLTVVDRLR